MLSKNGLHLLVNALVLLFLNTIEILSFMMFS
jgi:hypothetical protein